MTPAPSTTRNPRRPGSCGRAGALGVVLLAGCVLGPQSPSPSVTTGPTPSPTARPTASVPAGSVSPSASPAPTFAIERPPASDPRVVTVSVEPALDGDSGELLVTVTSHADQRIDELVLRWSSALNDVLFLAPFVPSEDRIRDGGPPLVQAWTKWVIGPGERGEPAGTISLGYGPLLPGATLAMPIHAERRVPGPVAFDLQVLAGEGLLTLDDGGDAVLRVEVP
jgi:hypothetical protein